MYLSLQNSLNLDRNYILHPFQHVLIIKNITMMTTSKYREAQKKIIDTQISCVAELIFSGHKEEKYEKDD